MANVLTSTEVKLHLNLALDKTVSDAEVNSFTSRAEAAIANRIGPLVPTTKTEAHDGGAHLVKTLYRPIQAVVSLNESYGTYNRVLTEQPLDGTNGFNAYGYTVEKDAGVITRRISGVAGPFASGRRNVVVNYTYGWSTDGTSATLPQDLVELILEEIRVRWESSQRGGSVAPGRPDEPASTPGMLDSFSPFVEQGLQQFEDFGIY